MGLDARFGLHGEGSRGRCEAEAAEVGGEEVG